MLTLHGTPSGTVTLPSSKSVAHRALICSFLAGGSDVIINGQGNDILATRNCLEAMQSDPCVLDCRDSGSTLRFLMPVAAALGLDATFRTGGQLAARPVSEFRELIEAHKTGGRLQSGDYSISGNVSSQYVSGLLMALPLLDGDSTVSIEGPCESVPYINMTIAVLKRFGIEISDGYKVCGGQKYSSPGTFAVEGDWSAAAFWLVAGCTGQGMELKGLDWNSGLQGDSRIADILKSMGGDISNGVARPSELHGITVDCRDIPDLVPAIAVAAAKAQGQTVLTGIHRLRFKESDRVSSIIGLLRAFGIECSATHDCITITGGRPHEAVVRTYSDHRIAMAAAIMGDCTIDDADCVAKSYPAFFDEMSRLGVKIERA